MKKTGETERMRALKKTKKQIAAVLIVGTLLAIADIIMSSDNEIAVEESYGQLYLIRPATDEENGFVSLSAIVEGKEGVYEEDIDIMLEPYEKEHDRKSEPESSSVSVTEEEKVQYSIRSIADDINNDNSKKRISLPASLETGEKIIWEVEEGNNSNTLIIVILMVGAIAIIYKERYSFLKKKREEEKASVSRQLPGFINRIVLLLNAGMVLSSAFEKSVEESMAYGHADKDYFYSNMKSIYMSMKTANGSMHGELRSFAKKCGVQEMMRISNIINDNVSKGTELTQKLQSESELLWMERKKKCEELGKLAETKLTLPLMLFLLVLVVLTIAPAMLEL